MSVPNTDGPDHQFKVYSSQLTGVQAVEAVSKRSFGRHTHGQFGIGMVLRGAQDSVSGRGEVRAVPGDLITVNPNEIHDGRPVAGESRVWQMLYFDPDVIEPFVMILGRNRGGEFQYPVLQRPNIANAFDRLYSALIDPPADFCRDIIEQELLDILAPLWGQESPPLAQRLRSDAVLPAKARIDEAPELSVTLTELANAAGLSSYHFLRSFKSATGLPPHAYRLQRQLQRPRILILRARPLAEVAAEAGFSDQSHLTRHFVRAYGITPGALAASIRSSGFKKRQDADCQLR